MENKTPTDQLINLKGKTAIVTGGAVGIGLGIVTRLAEAGANVMIADVNQEKADKSANDLSQTGLSVKSKLCNVADESAVEALVTETVEVFGSVDILVNNAGIYPNIPLSKMTTEDFMRVIEINLKSVYLTTKHVSEQMIKKGGGGKIINVTSIDALHPSMIGLAHYDASKHGVWGFTKNSALELAQHKIWVNAIAPGGIATPGVQAGTGGSVPPEEMAKIIEAFMANIPMRRMGDPDEIGKVALFLASDMSSYMTGSQVVVDGGALLS